MDKSRTHHRSGYSLEDKFMVKHLSVPSKSLSEKVESSDTNIIYILPKTIQEMEKKRRDKRRELMEKGRISENVPKAVCPWLGMDDHDRIIRLHEQINLLFNILSNTLSRIEKIEEELHIVPTDRRYMEKTDFDDIDNYGSE